MHSITVLESPVNISTKNILIKWAAKKDIQKLMDKLPEVIAAKKRMSAHIKKYGSLESFNDDHIKFVKPL